MTFFRSRWIDAPAHVTELDPHALPAGFRAAAVAAGLKPEGLDVGVLSSDAPATVSAARFTTNARVGAPVIVSRQAQLDRLRVVVANSGGSSSTFSSEFAASFINAESVKTYTFSLLSAGR